VSESANVFRIKAKTLSAVLSKMMGVPVSRATYQTKPLQGGTVGDVRLVTGVAVCPDGDVPYKVVLKTQKKWTRHGDPLSWRREYDLYNSGLCALFGDGLCWPTCYHSEEAVNETRLWLEYIDGVTGAQLTIEHNEQAATELGRFQGRVFSETPHTLQNFPNLSKADGMKNFYLHYRSWDEVYDYVRKANCDIPPHLCKMIIDADEKSADVWKSIEKLPVVLCHRDFWVTNIFVSDGKIRLIDWDTTGWGYLGEDVISLIADESDVNQMLELYNRLVPAYRRGFQEFADISQIPSLYVYERIVMHFGYRLVEWYLDADSPERKALQVETLQKIYEMGKMS